MNLICIYTVYLYAEVSHSHKHQHAADDFSRRHFQMHFFVVGEEYDSCPLKYSLQLKYFRVVPKSNVRYTILYIVRFLKGGGAELNFVSVNPCKQVIYIGQVYFLFKDRWVVFFICVQILTELHVRKQ